MDLLPYAHGVAQRFFPPTGAAVGMEDLRQAAAVGLWRGLGGWRPDKGASPLTYCMPFMLGEVRYALAQAWDTGGRRRLSSDLRLVGAVRQRFVAASGREPTVREVAALAKVSPERLSEALAVAPHLSLTDDPPAGPDEDPVGRTATDRAALAVALSHLGEDERRVVALRHLGGLTQAQTARRLAVSQPTVHRLERRALRRLAEDLEGRATGPGRIRSGPGRPAP